MSERAKALRTRHGGSESYDCKGYALYYAGVAAESRRFELVLIVHMGRLQSQPQPFKSDFLADRQRVTKCRRSEEAEPPTRAPAEISRVRAQPG